MKKNESNKGFEENKEFEEKMDDIFLESIKKQYLPFYDDASLVKIESTHPLTATEKTELFNAAYDTFGKRRAILYYSEYNRRKMFFVISKKFRKNVDKMVKGSKVVFTHPDYPNRHDVAVVQSDGIRYEGGAAVFDLWVQPKNCVDIAKGNDLGPYFALYWRPVEEVSNIQKSHS